MPKWLKRKKSAIAAKKEKVTFFTSESVSPGHPDKVCDVIADSIKDYILERDHSAHVAIEVAVTTNFVLLMGEVKTNLEKIPFISIAKKAIADIGYIHSDCNFSSKSVKIWCKVHSQSADIDMGVSHNDGEMGCFPKGTLIYTQDGFVKIEDALDKMVLTDDGKYHRVKRVFNNGLKRFLKLNTVLGREIFITDNHEVRSDNFEWKKAGDLEEGDKLYAPFISSNVEQEENALWYLRGWALGDGYFGKYPKVREGYLLTHGEDEEKHIQSLLELIGFQVNKSKFDGCTYFYLYGDNIERLVGDVLYYNEDRSKDIFIDRIPLGVYNEVIRGWFDSDGNVRDKITHADSVHPTHTLDITVSSKSEKSMRTLQFLLQRIGIASRLKSRIRFDKRGFSNIEVDLSLYSEDARKLWRYFGGFKLLRKRDIQDSVILSHSTRSFYVNDFCYCDEVESIEDCFCSDGYDLEVEDNHSYVANGIIVHNSGDQGMQFGYACNESEDFIPLTWKIARALTSRAWLLQKDTLGQVLRPDIKSQVTAKYINGQFDSIDTIVMACSHVKDVPQEQIRQYVLINVLEPTLEEFGYNVSEINHIYINGTGQFSIYGPDGDSGLTGRKLVVDLYGGHACTGGGTLQGKDPSKVDNSAALMARFLAKNVVAAGLADRCQIQLAYCIGIAKPVSINIDAFGTEHCDLSEVEKWIETHVDCSPNAIIKRFDLFKKTSYWDYADCGAFGYMGDDQVSFIKHITYPWELLTLVDDLKSFKK